MDEHAHHHRRDLDESHDGAFAVGIALNLVFAGVEAAYGAVSRSVALVADAIHNLSDVLGLVLAWVALLLARRRPTRRRTYGLRKTTILAALGNALFLLVAIGGVMWEAVGRMRRPAPVAGRVVMIVAAVGVVVNGVSALLFSKGRKGDVNLRGAFLHLAADASVSLGVVLTAVAIMKTGWMWLDPLVSLVVSLVILVGTWKLLRESLQLAVDGVPATVQVEAIQSYLAGLPGVHEIHDLHVWAVSTTETALTAHLVMEPGVREQTVISEVNATLHADFAIDHTTIQIEAPDLRCRLSSPGSACYGP